MKKITLIAAAAMVASTAIAGTPVENKANRSLEIMRPAKAMTVEALRASRLGVSRTPAYVDRTAEGDLTDVTPEVLYVPTANAFYSGLFPDTRQYTYQQGFTGIRNAVGFRNLTAGATAFDWQYGRVNGLTEDRKDYTYDYTNSTETNLFMELNPYARYSYPTLAATYGEEIYNSAAAVNQLYHCGRSPYYWGWSNVEDDAEAIYYSDLLGVSPATYKLTGATLIGEFMIEREGSKNFADGGWNANGVYENWEAYSEAGVFELSNLAIKSFVSYIPEMPSPYQMDAAWFWFQSEVKEGAGSQPLALTVYPLSEEGMPDYANPLGSGEFNIPEGKYSPVAAEDGEMPVVELTAVDEDGYAIDSPVCIEAGTPVLVLIEGLDNENIISFEMIINKGAQSPVTMDRTVRNYLYPTHAYALINADVVDYEAAAVDDEGDGELSDVTDETPETYNADFLLRSPYNYFTDATRQALFSPVDFAMYFDINFPVVINYDEASSDYETANFNYEVKQEGETITVPVGCSYKIDVLMEEGLAECVTSSWLTATAVFDEEESITNVTIVAEANDGADRIGYVIYRGYAIDFWITVNQKGTQDGIQVIDCKPVAKGTRFFDLQGRELTTQPASGIYFQTVDGVTTKHLAK